MPCRGTHWRTGSRRKTWSVTPADGMVTGVGSINQALFGPECSNIGMGGPAMVEGGGLGVFKPEQTDPSAVQSGNGVINILVADEGACLGPAGR